MREDRKRTHIRYGSTLLFMLALVTLFFFVVEMAFLISRISVILGTFHVIFFLLLLFLFFLFFFNEFIKVDSMSKFQCQFGFLI